VETTLHAVLPHTCVVHVHSVNVLAWAALADSPRAFAARMEGIRWAWIPYIHPGLPLALQIREALTGAPDVIIMQNHGLIVGGESCESAEALLHYVERRLDLPMRVTPPPRTDALRDLAGTDWLVPAEDDVHGLGTDVDSFRIATAGTLYPDHCVYLGHALAPCYREQSPNDAAADYQEKWGKRPPVLACQGLGVLTDPSLSRAGREMLACLAATARRIPADAEVHYLSSDNVSRLMNWDAEHYRQAMARQMESQ
jgi:rhamnose utilization protein RhaD (predicted bifunctional aldolase and dehydrogenase)